MIWVVLAALAETGDSGDTGDTGTAPEDTGEYVADARAEKVYEQPQTGCGAGGSALLLLPFALVGRRRVGG